MVAEHLISAFALVPYSARDADFVVSRTGAPMDRARYSSLGSRSKKADRPRSDVMATNAFVELPPLKEAQALARAAGFRNF